ncbi:2061_t:CDS:2 [Cetraspora pellucida]|uniref:2061_t:CDS:1 n=1 Tax=Cetraspora pellucida TaxID=1433469 RepID=A0ACA9JW73_9GLOM|nr:2061_t:CDS:2 [Cetraspora pellucida]
MTKSEGRNLEEINKKKILNFGDLSRHQKDLGISDGAWNMEPNWRTYMKKAQLRKQDLGYYITAGIKFYCAQCDRKSVLALTGIVSSFSARFNKPRQILLFFLTAGELPKCLFLSSAYGILAYKSAIVTITRETEEVERRKPR